MTLHVFNPEHDIALAFNRRHLTMPHAAQELRMNLGWLPALWASDGDIVLVDDVPFAQKASRRHRRRMSAVTFVGIDDLHRFHPDAVSPWGWDIAICTQLSEAGVDRQQLPGTDNLSDIRLLSSRRQCTEALAALRQGVEDLTCGQADYMTTAEGVNAFVEKWQDVVVKAPWSSSGRGVRYIADAAVTTSLQGFIRNTMTRQGGIMMEPYYNKVKDFGMEFTAHGDGSVTYDGLSLFSTLNGAYTGNLLATEEDKTEMLGRYVETALLENVRNKACKYFSTLFRNKYAGPFGVDMMIVARGQGQGFMLHPCVEINLRRTMGHVALALSPEDRLQPRKVMTIEHRVNYVLKVADQEIKLSE
ncbi:MAG: hypothetical protein IJ928_04995 [Prevotella sp.]|nr:hypothetical protein [Prevotella sp.]